MSSNIRSLDLPDYNLRPVWDAILEVYKPFAEICKKHNLCHYVVDGNAIGAVRHGGFIPWDDDFDVAMPRSDYDKFLEIAAGELSQDLRIVTWRNTPEFNMLSAKLQLANKDEVEKIEKETGRMLSNGIFIDIFPIDGTTSSTVRWRIGSIWYAVLQSLLRFHNDQFGHQTRKGKIVWLAGMVLSPVFFWLWTHDAICRRLEKLQRKYDFGKTPLYDSSTFLSGLTRRRRHKSSVWGKPRMAKYESIEVPLPEKYEEYLSFWYGDYMKLPSASCRVPAHQYAWRCPWWMGPTNEYAWRHR